MICVRKLSVIFLGARSLECTPKKLERTPASAPQIQKERAPPCAPENGARSFNALEISIRLPTIITFRN